MTTTSRCCAACAIATFLAAAGCAHTVHLNSYPEGATVYVDGEEIGETPATYRETTGWGGSHLVRVEKDGYQPVSRVVTQSDWHSGLVVASVVGGLFLCWPALGGIAFSRQMPSVVEFELKSKNTAIARNRDATVVDEDGAY
jgi:hypothetical protein